mgnify:CR=1 FL=1
MVGLDFALEYKKREEGSIGTCLFLWVWDIRYLGDVDYMNCNI